MANSSMSAQCCQNQHLLSCNCPGTPRWGTDWNIGIDNIDFDQKLSAVPLPAAVWLFGSGIAALFGFTRKRA